MKERARQVVTTNIADATAVLQQLADLEAQVEAAAAIIAEALLSGHKLLACGNGGSAADASHLTTEFVARFDRERRAYPAISLATHGGDLTAIGNDYSFADLFARQVQAYGKPGRCAGGVYHQRQQREYLSRPGGGERPQTEDDCLSGPRWRRVCGAGRRGVAGRGQRQRRAFRKGISSCCIPSASWSKSSSWVRARAVSGTHSSLR